MNQKKRLTTQTGRDPNPDSSINSSSQPSLACTMTRLEENRLHIGNIKFKVLSLPFSMPLSTEQAAVKPIMVPTWWPETSAGIHGMTGDG